MLFFFIRLSWFLDFFRLGVIATSPFSSFSFTLFHSWWHHPTILTFFHIFRYFHLTLACNKRVSFIYIQRENTINLIHPRKTERKRKRESRKQKTKKTTTNKRNKQRKKERKRMVESTYAYVTTLDFDETGCFLAAGYSDGTLSVYCRPKNCSKFKVYVRFVSHDCEIMKVKWCKGVSCNLLLLASDGMHLLFIYFLQGCVPIIFL